MHFSSPKKAVVNPVQQFVGAVTRYVNKRPVGPVGFELGQESLYMAQVEYGESGPTLRATVAVSYPEEREMLLNSPRDLKTFIKSALGSKPFKGSSIVTCMPADQIKLIMINYKVLPGESEPETIMRYAMERCEDDPGRWVVDYMPVRTWDKAGGERAALVAIAERVAVIEYLELLRLAGLKVEALEIGPAAILRLVSLMQKKHRHENILTINFGMHKTYLTVLAGRRLLLDREIDYGEQHIITLLSDTLEMRLKSAQSLLYEYGVSKVQSDESTIGKASGNAQEIAHTVMEILKPNFMELAEEVRKVLVYTASQMRGASVDYVYLLGSIARCPGMDELMSAILSLPCGVLDPLSAFQQENTNNLYQDQDPIVGIAIATGCALRGQFTDE